MLYSAFSVSASVLWLNLTIQLFDGFLDKYCHDYFTLFSFYFSNMIYYMCL